MNRYKFLIFLFIYGFLSIFSYKFSLAQNIVDENISDGIYLSRNKFSTV